MFEDRQVIQPTPAKSAAPKPDAAASDIVIHTMPKEFYDREVKFKDEDKPLPPKPVAPPAAPIPVVPPPVAKPKPVPPPPRRRSRLGIVIVILLLLILLVLGGAVFAYTQGWIFPQP